MAGKEAIFDIVTIALQQWPDESFAQIAAENTKNTDVANALLADIKRIYHLCTGDENFDAAWDMFMRPLVLEIVLAMHRFWAAKKANRLVMRTWKLELTGDGKAKDS